MAAIGAGARLWRQFDWLLLLALTGILAISLACIFSVTHNTAHRDDLAQQFLMIWPALALALVLAGYGYEWLRPTARIIYALNLILLVAVMVAGHSALGAQRWIGIAGFRFQPSEFAKLALIITLAKVLSEKNVHSPEGIFTVLATVGVPFILIFKQPDLGTSLVYGAIAVGMLFWAGMPASAVLKLATPLVSVVLYFAGFGWWILYLLALGVFLAWTRKQNWALPLGIWVVNAVAGIAATRVWDLLKEYQKRRILTFLNPEADPLGSGYHVIQSKIAIGSGGLWGKGLLHGTQTQLHFIPEQHTDFIFSVVGEELGFAGGFALLLLYAIYIGRGVAIAHQASNAFGSLLAIGIVTMMLFHVVVNVGMATGLLPVVGIPLPLMSYGRTALITNLLAFGLLEAVAMRRKKILF
ncbi:MAG: rod shape-determining protein RodA [Candidatus Sericytochromatia bacterium]|nr:rod shape-determining protein RodA [Candidatus Tanganyikabacteria bacterium]